MKVSGRQNTVGSSELCRVKGRETGDWKIGGKFVSSLRLAHIRSYLTSVMARAAVVTWAWAHVSRYKL